MKKRGILLFFVCCLLFGCAEQKETQQENTSSVVVTMPVTSEPEYGFDPTYGWGAGEHTHEPLIQSTLLVTKQDLTLAPELATSYMASKNGMEWTVNIREDAVFSNGEKVTAEDVAFTYNMCKENNSVQDFTMLEYAEALDETTVIFHMTKPFSVWPYTMAIVGIVPAHSYTADYGSAPIGSGRYILAQWDKGQQVILEANPTYYGEKPEIEKIIVVFMEEEASVAAAQAGMADVAYTSATYADIPIESYGLIAVSSVDNRGINLPAQQPVEKDGIIYGNTVTSDLAIRQAINIGIDRETLITNVLNGYGTPAYSVCDNMPWFASESVVSYDLEEAKKILEDNGWQADETGIRSKNGGKAEFSILYPPSDSIRQALAEELSNQLKELGVLAKPECVGWDVAYDLAQSQPLLWGWGAHSPMELYHIYHTEGENPRYSPYYNAIVNSYMEEALQSTDIEDSYTLWQKAQWDGTTGIVGDLPWIWLCNIDHLYFVKEGLSIGEQKIHPHGHGWSILDNIDQWSWQKE